ncbi:hypothetical protein Snoj_04320 [Streptomyces nojiriensis]|uniref:Ferredoxin n=1 Tax=Streptomyces nojiriensis TaxID=66374 RepID=A0ABQ3SEH4_9ACTN|nr:hypothetical protein [Streptomyces nojiriensis]GGS25828.1 hypothetical protein GCM10010205_64790 [Streptomyces nojiriensis]GHI66514.1 hypothetical protein Snoj_04320 [Streptomyces nojiriensis]
MTTSAKREALMGATDIVAYYYGEKTVCPDCAKDLAAPYYLIDSPESFTTEQVLDEAAKTAGINRNDEDSYTSYEFPKILYAEDLVDGETCFVCDCTL